MHQDSYTCAFTYSLHLLKYKMPRGSRMANLEQFAVVNVIIQIPELVILLTNDRDICVDGRPGKEKIIL